MKAKLEDKQKAILLRKKGFTYKEILSKLPVAKSSLSGWFKYIEYSDQEIIKLRENVEKRILGGRIKASLANRDRRIIREKNVFDVAEKFFNENVHNPLFIIGIVLYWAEGSKRTGEFQFINSDPEMIRFMMYWSINFMAINKDKIKYRLFMHKIYDYENCEEFWATIVKVPVKKFEKTIYKPTTHKVKKNPDYKGCLRISIGSMEALRRVKAFQKLLIKYYISKMRS